MYAGIKNKRIKFFQQIKEIYPNSSSIVIPIENEWEFTQLMKALDTLEIYWANGDLASTGITYRDEFAHIIQLNFISITLIPENKDEENTGPDFHIHYGKTFKGNTEELQGEHIRKNLIPVEDIINLILESERQANYNEPHLPLINTMGK